jgi:hypothetical protein
MKSILPKPNYWALLLLLLLVPICVGASVENKDRSASISMDPEDPIPIGQAIDRLAVELNAHIVLFSVLEDKRVILNLGTRSPVDTLKSILKGYSYAVIFNDPSHAYSDMSNELSAAVPPTTSEGPGLSMADLAQERLTKRIRQLEGQIDSGEADRFFERWSQYKDPKYIYNHRADLKRLRKKRTGLEVGAFEDDDVPHPVESRPGKYRYTSMPHTKSR